MSKYDEIRGIVNVGLRVRVVCMFHMWHLSCVVWLEYTERVKHVSIYISVLMSQTLYNIFLINYLSIETIWYILPGKFEIILEIMAIFLISSIYIFYEQGLSYL